MRKIYHLLLSCIIVTAFAIMPNLSFSQDEGGETKMTHKEKKELFDNYWFINLHVSGVQQNTDVVINKYISPISNWRFGWGGNLGWQFHPIWGLRAGLNFGNLYGQSKKDVFWMQTLDPRFANGVFFRAKLFDYNLEGIVNFSNLISGYNPDRLVDVYGIVGWGMTEWTTEGYYFESDGSATLRWEDGKDVTGALPFADYRGYHDGFKDGWNRKSHISSGLGGAFHIIPQLDANLEFQFKVLTGGKETNPGGGHNPEFRQGDFLDNMENGEQMVFNDMYSYVSVGLTYKFVESNPLKKMEKNYGQVTFKAEPDPLEAHGGKVPVKITGTFPEGYFHPKAAMWAEPYLVCDGTTIPLKPILLKGTEVGGEGIVISKDGGSFTYETVVDYNESCRAAELFIEPVAFIPKEDLPADLTKEKILQDYKKYVVLPATKLADGTIVTPELFTFDQTGAIVPHGYVLENILTKEANIYFLVNKHNLNWNVPLNKVEANKNALQEMIDFIALGYKIKDITIDGWASPEGEETFNQGLSENRTKTAQTYVVDKIKGLIKAKETKLTIKDAAKDVQYNLAHHGPDWNGFISALQSSDIKEKSSILNVINSAGTPAKKEEEIRNMIKIYPEIEAKLLEPLRRAEIAVNCYEPKKTKEEIIALSTSNPSALDEKELLYAASIQTDKKVQLDIYKTAINQFPNSYKGYANAGALEVEMNELKAAKAHLEKAASLNANSGEVHNNLGIVYGLEGDFAKAEEHFTKASQLGTNASYNLGVINIHKGEYAKALSQFGSKTCDYNVALAYIASKNYPPAEKQLECAAKTAKTHYLMAILGSRTSNTNMLFENLGKAIQMDAAYKTEAKIDREFIKYFADPNFTSLVN
jgi:tetratricopeptide (TPR) repeat protein